MNFPDCNLIVHTCNNTKLDGNWSHDGFHSSECVAATEICSRSYDTVQPLQ
jgi:hypothetical protein